MLKQHLTKEKMCKSSFAIFMLFYTYVKAAQFDVNYYLNGDEPKIDCLCLRWTKWIQLGSPYNLYHPPRTYAGLIHFGKTTAQLNNIDVCSVPVSSECQVLVPYLLPNTDLDQDYTVCPYVLNDQVGKDGVVQIRFLCWDGSCPCLEWSRWYNNDRPDDEGDLELLHHTITKKEWPCTGGTQPIDVECRTASGELLFKSHNKFLQCDLEGFKCLNDLQGDNCNCDDYMVRFLCLKQSPRSDHFYTAGLEMEEGNCSRPNCFKEKPIGRAGAFAPVAKAAATRQFSLEIPTPPKKVYGYGPCFVPLSCPRKDVAKMGRMFLMKRSIDEKKLYIHSAKSQSDECKQFPNSKNCSSRGRPRRSKTFDLHLSNNTYFENFTPRRKASIKKAVQEWKVDKFGHDVNISHNDNRHNVDKHSPRWKQMPPYIHQTVPAYDQYHYNYPIMTNLKDQEIEHHYNHQVSTKNDHRGQRKKH